MAVGHLSENALHVWNFAESRFVIETFFLKTNQIGDQKGFYQMLPLKSEKIWVKNLSFKGLELFKTQRIAYCVSAQVTCSSFSEK